MTEQQFDRLLEKLDWIGNSLETLLERFQEAQNFPRDVRVTEDRRTR